jgi:hypothetical protein
MSSYFVNTLNCYGQSTDSETQQIYPPHTATTAYGSYTPSHASGYQYSPNGSANGEYYTRTGYQQNQAHQPPVAKARSPHGNPPGAHLQNQQNGHANPPPPRQGYAESNSFSPVQGSPRSPGSQSESMHGSPEPRPQTQSQAQGSPTEGPKTQSEVQGSPMEEQVHIYPWMKRVHCGHGKYI